MGDSKKLAIEQLMSKHGGSLLLSKRQTAAELQVSEMTVDRLRKQGALRSKKIGGQVFFTIEEIAHFIAY